MKIHTVIAFVEDADTITAWPDDNRSTLWPIDVRVANVGMHMTTKAATRLRDQLTESLQAVAPR